jgi:hypothetical protein
MPWLSLSVSSKNLNLLFLCSRCYFLSPSVLLLTDKLCSKSKAKNFLPVRADLLIRKFKNLSCLSLVDHHLSVFRTKVSSQLSGLL